MSLRSVPFRRLGTSYRSYKLALPARLTLQHASKSALITPLAPLSWTTPSQYLSNNTKKLSTMTDAQAQPTAQPTAVFTVDPKLEKLRSLFAASGNIDAIVVPSEDPHMSEYPPDCDARRSYISGFDGSAGTAVITATEALLWTDGRYFLQAEQQLGKDWTLMRHGTPTCPEISDWLVGALPEGATIGIDPLLHTIDAASKLAAQLEESGKKLVPLTVNPVDQVWEEQGVRPARPTAPLRVHSLEWAGVTVVEKLDSLRHKMVEAKAGATMVTMLDEVAWLLNLRGGDVMCNPVFLSYVIVTPTTAVLYVDGSKVTSEVAAHLKEAGVTVKPYEDALVDVRAMAAAGTSIWMDPSKVSYAVKLAAIEAAASSKGSNGTAKAAAAKSPANNNGSSRKRSRQSSPADSPNGNGATTTQQSNRSVVLEKPTPIGILKACKNDAELAGLKEAHIRDGVALVQFFCWVEKTIASGTTLTECQIDDELTARRAAQTGYIEASFPTIAGAGPNGAIIHYRPLPDTCRTVDTNTLLLLDSGGQYDCGTTDITRTMHFGTPTEHQKACYTRVLQGHIAIDTCIFPEGTPGCAIDVLARTALWKVGLNYRHGTGHGVGAALNVHEGPQSISSRFWNTQPLLPRMVCSNEPGYYEDNSFGIRIENLFIVVEADTEFRYGGQSYYTCESVTVCPIQKKLMSKELMSEAEIAWVDRYHQHVYNVLSPRLAGQDEELAWLKQATSPL